MLKSENSQSLLGSRALDFWCIGGASILVWALFKVLAPLQSEYWAIGRHFGNLSAFAATAVLLINYPHFIVSYKLSYGQGFAFIRRHWWQLIVVPIILFALMFTSWIFYRHPNMELGLLKQYPWSSGPLFGEKVLSYLVMTMYFTVGWHYSKQMFGTMMVFAKYDKYQISGSQRLLCKSALFGVWFVNYATFSAMGAAHQYNGINYVDIKSPEWLAPLAWVFYITSTVSFALFVVVKNYRETKNLPSASFLLPIVVFSIWWIPTFIQNDFYWQLVPFFHSLQYLCFVRRSEVANWDSQQMNSRPDYYIRFACYALFILVIGWLTFEMIPSLMDHNRSAARVEGIAFFYVCLNVFINIHHYFIDNVLWRFRDSQVAQRLFVS